MSEQLQDEILSINSIYDAETLKLTATDGVGTLKIPAKPQIVIRLEFPADYPDAPPSILGTESTGPDVVKGEGLQLVELLRTILSEVYTVGVPCIFDLIEEATGRFPQLGTAQSQLQGSQALEAGQDDIRDTTIDSDDEQQGEDLGEEPPWVLSDVITEKKSVFVARAANVDSVEQAKQYVRHLLVTDKKAARATHNITAWRISAANNVQFQDCDDDGETAAGGRLLHLLELMDVWNVMVVVTRWYGGVHLGADRFRIINQAARDAVVKGGWVSEPASKKKSKR